MCKAIFAEKIGTTIGERQEQAETGYGVVVGWGAGGRAWFMGNTNGPFARTQTITVPVVAVARRREGGAGGGVGGREWCGESVRV